jgi:hypothetical protein
MARDLKNNQGLSTDDLKRRWREYVTACDLVRAENAAALLRWEYNGRGLRPTEGSGVVRRTGGGRRAACPRYTATGAASFTAGLARDQRLGLARLGLDRT